MSQRLAGLFSELRRRRVLRSGAIYIAIAWVLIQVATTTLPIFEISDAYTRYFTIALIAGFPIAVFLSWVFDIDAGSIIHKTAPLDTAPTGQTVAIPHGHDLDAAEIPARSIAVMPFANVGNDPENEFFSDGISEELLNLLAKSRDIKVAARTSCFALKNSTDDVRTIGQRLGVRHVLEGGVRRAAERVRITAQLIDVVTGYHLWSSSFDRDMDDIFALQDEIAASIVQALKITLDESLGEEVPLRTSVPTEDMEAYQLYLRGLYLWQRRGETAIRGAITALSRAVEQDPAFAEATALLATAQAALHEYSGEEREDGFAIAEPLARKAMQLDPALGAPHAVLGYIGLRRWDWESAVTHLGEALKREPNAALTHQWYSNLLNDLAYQQDALRHAEMAYAADRLSPQANNILALNYALLGRNADAQQHAAAAREFGLGGAVPDFVDYFVYLRNRDYAHAVSTMVASLKRSGRESTWVEPVVDAIADTTKVDQACRVLHAAHEADTITTGMAIMQFILLQQARPAFDLAETQLEDHSLIHLWFFLPEAAPLRKHPRFGQLIERMGIREYWQRAGWPDAIDLKELQQSNPGNG
ncbi:MAG: hypothetical protein HKN70_13960 [Gammaproteobacteria bacterium]|nr:hypothetical protein [Gammaproteobacteria bacterium]